jgi:hypothetical protein
MEYTTLATVLGIISANANPMPRPTPAPFDDTVITEAIVAASRAIDREVTGAVGSDDYFKTETLTLAETGPAIVDRNGDLMVWMRKPAIITLTALEYRTRGNEPWTAADMSKVTTSGLSATYWAGRLAPGPVMCRATYTGGLGAATANLPAELQRAAAVLAARYYKEGKAGLGDVIGVAEFGTMTYTKAIPLEVLRLLAPYSRPIPW